jgi:hypothetical protein
MGNTSKHLVTDRPFTKKAIEKVFLVLWNIEDYVVLALLPSYLEREGSSLVYMVQDLIHYQNILIADFTYTNHDELIKNLIELDRSGQNVTLIGVTYY